jgi:rubrerythrin
MPRETLVCLAAAFAETTRLAARCAIYASQAAREGDPSARQLFAAAAASLNVQARRYGRLLRGTVAGTDTNRRMLIETEIPALQSLLAQCRQWAGDAEWKSAREAFAHADTVAAQLESLRRQLVRPAAATELLVCQICGHIASGSAPEACPVCGAVAGKFKPVGPASAL